MLDHHDLTLHGLTLKQLASAADLADITGQEEAAVAADLDTAVSAGQVVAARGSYMITPVGRAHLDEIYSQSFAELRADAGLQSALADFERGVNKQMLSLMTSWQTIAVDGAQVANDHSDSDYDAKVIDKLARLHERAESVLAPLAEADPVVGRFVSRLDGALQRVDRGEHDYVSNVRLDSYHTVWYQMHEHLLRMMGQEREE